MRQVPDTQRAAFDAVRQELPDRRQAVLAAFEGHPAGLALFQVAARLDLPVHCVSGRITELRKAGLVEDSGARIVNPESGKKAIVWRPTRGAEPQRELFAQ